MKYMKYMPFVYLHMFDQLFVHIDMKYVLFMLCLNLCVHIYINVFELQLVHTSQHTKCNVCMLSMYIHIG
jgi:hypothetical protein